MIYFYEGKPLIIGGKIAMSEDCCCQDDAPCTCENPDGYSRTYTLTCTLIITDNGTPTTTSISPTAYQVCMDEDTDCFCEWRLPSYGVFDGIPINAYRTIFLNTTTCCWEISLGCEEEASIFSNAEKCTGASPVGNYSDYYCDVYGDGTYIVEMTGISVTEP